MYCHNITLYLGYNERVKKWLVEILMLSVGNFILAYSVQAFILPGSILTGGLAGIAVLLKPYLPISEEVIISVLMVVLFLLGFIFLGKKFAIETLFSSIVYPILLLWMSHTFPVFEVEPIVASIYGGVLAGLGIGIVFRCGASTGGMDIPPLIISKYFHVDVSLMVFITDALTVCFGLYVYGLEPVLIGLFSVYATSQAIKLVVTWGGSNSLSVQIISDSYMEISALLQKELRRGVTLFDAQGGYRGDPKKVIMIVIDRNQYTPLMNLVKQVDSNAFIITSDAKEVHGEGFSYSGRV